MCKTRYTHACGAGYKLDQVDRGQDADLHLLLGIYALRYRCQLQVELGLRGYCKDEIFQWGSVLVAQEEGDLALTALILRFQSDLQPRKPNERACSHCHKPGVDTQHALVLTMQLSCVHPRLLCLQAV